MELKELQINIDISIKELKEYLKNTNIKDPNYEQIKKRLEDLEFLNEDIHFSVEQNDVDLEGYNTLYKLYSNPIY